MSKRVSTKTIIAKSRDTFRARVGLASRGLVNTGSGSGDLSLPSPRIFLCTASALPPFVAIKTPPSSPPSGSIVHLSEKRFALEPAKCNRFHRIHTQSER